MNTIDKEFNEALNNFANAAQRLGKALRSYESNHLVCDTIYFLSHNYFSEDKLKNMVHVTDDLSRMSRIENIIADSVVNIEIFDEASGRAKVILNEPKYQKLVVEWLEEPAMCYSCQKQIEKGKRSEYAYHDIYDISRYYSDTEIEATLEEVFDFMESDTISMKDMIDAVREYYKYDLIEAIEKAFDEVNRECTEGKVPMERM
jgi:hypothetical protein